MRSIWNGVAAAHERSSAKRLLKTMASSPGVFHLVATVPTGLERGAAEECREVLGKETAARRGSITCTLDTLDELAKFDQLRSIDNYRTVVKTLPHFCKEESTVLDRLQSLPFTDQLDWTHSLKLWQYYSDHIQPSSSSSPDSHEEEETNTQTQSDPQSTSDDVAESSGATNSPPDNEGSSPRQPYSSLLKKSDVTFRVTCTRSGRKHVFSSQDAAGHFGAGLADYFGWKVCLKEADIEVLLGISGDSASVGVALTRTPKFKRNIAHFGPTTLRSTIAYGMLRCAKIQPGDIVLDPLCGGGSISIEGSIAWPDTLHLAGDIHDLAVQRVSGNITALLEQKKTRRETTRMKTDVCQWDVCRLPLRTATVDTVVTDLPFGKKSGNKLANWELYPRALNEMARVCRPDTARAVLLTHDNRALSKSVQRNVFWKRIKTLWVNVGGLETALYILQRSSMRFS